MTPRRPVRALIVTNIPAPYRIPVYELLDDGADVDLRVLYFAGSEADRDWTLPTSPVRSATLEPRVLAWRGRYIHFSRGVWSAVAGARPDVVITTGFNPAHLVAILYCVLHGVPHVVQTDGTVASEAGLTGLHRLARRATARRSAAFVAASESGLDLVRSWGAPADRLHRSPLATDNERFAPTERDTVRDIDVLFVGRFAEIKNPAFVLEVARAAAGRLGRRLVVALVGSGPLRDRLLEAAAGLEEELDVRVVGFQQQDVLPSWYRRARVFLFPTRWDPWGLVANEASAAGVPVLTTPEAGSAGELVRDGENGFVLPLDLEAWTDRLVRLLEDDRTWRAMSERAQDLVERYGFAAAADGLRAAILQATRY